MSNSLSVLVCGATGQQGGALARVLLDKGHRVRAFIRRPDSPEAKELKRLGAELAVGDFEEPSTIEDADRKSTRLNSSHANISYAVFCLKKKKTTVLLSDQCT